MKSIDRIATTSVGLTLSADDIIEFHVARLLLLMSICGTAGRIDGLTKLAKLDFFARYPDFFRTALAATQSETVEKFPTQRDRSVESAMVRHHYGPWDKRYYQVLAVLEAKALMTVEKEGNLYRFVLTPMGRERAKALASKSSFEPLVVRMREIKKAFGKKTGSSLKNLIYQLFDAEVSRRPMGKVIQK